MKWHKTELSRTGDTVFYGEHPTGLPIYVLPKSGYSSTYAVLTTRYGSVDTTFSTAERNRITVPAGIAHYLEHKLFENEDCDAFERYAETGASANAYTGFQQTAYLFSCTDRVEESLRILLDFVQNPYFTPENVQKERGIIGQEIRMCEDDPERLCMFQLLEMLYQNHPVRVDIAGTVDSIAKITPELLYDCYRTFYNLHNMVLVVSGNITAEEVERVADQVLKPAPPFNLDRRPVEEPETVSASRRETNMPVSMPLFHLGFKETVPPGYLHTAEELVAAELFLELLIGRASPLYSRLMQEGLINETFGGGYFEGAGYSALLFSGESRDPDALEAALVQEMERMRREGIDLQRFTEEKNAMYGRFITGLNDIENCADWVTDDHFYGRKPFSLIDTVATLEVQSVYTFLQERLNIHRRALSIVKGEP